MIPGGFPAPDRQEEGLRRTQGWGELEVNSAIAHCGRFRSLQMSSNLYNTPMRSNSLDGVMRAAAAIVALTAAMSLRIATAENSQDEYARITDWRVKRLASLTSE